MKEYIEKIFEVIFDGCTFGSVEDDYLIHYSQPCVIMDGSWVESEVNVYELAYKCKEWALKQNCSIESTYRNTIGLAWVVYNVKYDGYDKFGIKHEHTYKKEFHSDTEPEAIFKACEWILENKDKQ